jgi:hypothetical protein
LKRGTLLRIAEAGVYWTVKLDGSVGQVVVGKRRKEVAE